MDTPQLAVDTSFSGAGSSTATPSGGAGKRFPLYIAINAYTKRMEDELDMNPGDKIQVITDDGEFHDGWFYGRNLRTKEEGLYPVVFTQVLAAERKPTVMRAKSSKRIYSPSSKEDLVDSPVFSQFGPINGAQSPNLESGASMFTTVSNNNNNNSNSKSSLARNVSVKSTISDIDRALEDLNKPGLDADLTFGSAHDSGAGTSAGDVTQNTIYSTTKGLNYNEASTVSLPKNKNEILELLNVENWSPDEVTAYFIGHGFDLESARCFQQHKISGPILLELKLEHLKELDIGSFGTRFEMYKQIEVIREVVARKGRIGAEDKIQVDKQRDRSNPHSLMPAATLNAHPERGHYRKVSHSMEELPTGVPENRTPSTKHRPSSLWIGGHDPADEDESLFVSPRRAPKPPSYPSPVQPQMSPAVVNEGFHSIRDVSQSTRTDTLGSSDSKLSINGSKNSEPSSPFKNMMNRMSLLSPNKRDPSNEDQHSAISEESATSSVYASPSRSISLIDLKADKEKAEATKKHRRNSSIATFGSAANKEKIPERKPTINDRSNKVASIFLSPFKQQFTNNAIKNSPDHASPSVQRSGSTKSPKATKNSEKRSVSAKTSRQVKNSSLKNGSNSNQTRSVSEAVKTKNTKPRKQQTSAFTEGLRTISVRNAMKDSDFSGWMSKKGSGTVSTWKTRFFTLHGSRLSYFLSTTDTRERGLIDITAHRVVPAKEDDKLVSLFAASTGKGRFCFKLIPPQPGSKKGLTFTQPRTHYFAVDSKEDMRGWMAALIKATIDIDTSVPVVSSYSTPTVSLTKAQELLAEAREENKIREQELEKQDNLWDEDDNDNQQDKTHQTASSHHDTTAVTATSEENNSVNSAHNVSTTTNTSIGTNGFSSPFLLASGLASPAIARKTSRQQKYSTKAEDTGYFDTEHHKPTDL